MDRTISPPRTPPNWAAAIEATLLGSTATLLLAHAWRGTLAFYIHPRYAPLVVAVAAVLLAVMIGRLRGLADPPTGLAPRRCAGYLLLALPVALGLLLPARPLGADALAVTGLANGEAVRAALPDSEDSRRWNLLQWSTAVSVRGDEVQGREADVVGFVHHDPARPLDGFFVARLVIVCCVADGSGVSLPVRWPGGADLAPNSWVRVRGTLGSSSIAGSPEATLLATSVELIPRPASPYLNP